MRYGADAGPRMPVSWNIMAATSFEFAEWLTLAIGAVITWVGYQKTQERALIENGKLIKKQFWRSEALSLADISTVRYRYHGVSGFVAVWEFRDCHANTLVVESSAKGLDSVFAELQKQLPGFTLIDFEQLCRDGDVVDTLEIWKR